MLTQINLMVGAVARVLIALVVVVMLVLLLLSLRFNLEKQEEQVAYNMSALSWHVSEALLESQRLSHALRSYTLGVEDRDAVILAAELLWSRIDVLRHSELTAHPQLFEKVWRYSQILRDSETDLYDAQVLTVDAALHWRDAFDDLRDQMRATWIRDFLGDRGALTRAATSDLIKRRHVFELIIMGCIALLLIYLMIELRASHCARKREQSLRQQAIAASAAKSAFLANVSHEIRTPLNGVIGMAQELQETTLGPEQSEMLQVILTSGDLLLNTINDVLDLSKIESGQLSLETVAFDPQDSVRNAMKLYTAQAGDKGIALRLDIRSGTPTAVLGDPMRMVQVVNNLLSNAIKFTEAGAITVTLHAEQTGAADRTDLVLKVRDTGIGISGAAIQRIFSPFSQADASISRKHGGTGLGLTISRTLCRMMGGDLTVVSIPGDGTTFTARMRLEIATGRAMPGAAGGPSDAGSRPPAPGPRRLAVEPVSAGTVRSRPPSPGRTTERPDPPTTAAPRVLVVDDSEVNRLVLRRFLKDCAVTVVEADSGVQAVEAATTMTFDLILMDVQMPEMDGVEATRRIRATEADDADSRPVPIIAVTANVMAHQIAEYLEAGFDRVIPKPIRKAEIRREIAALSRAVKAASTGPTACAARADGIAQHENPRRLAFADCTRRWQFS